MQDSGIHREKEMATKIPSSGGGDVVVEGRKKLRVMVAIDESEQSVYALKWTLDHLFVTQLMREAASHQDFLGNCGTITVVTVQPHFQPYVYPATSVIYATPIVVDSYKKAQEQNATAIFDRALKLCEGKKVKTETLVFQGDPKEMICQATENMHFDLLVVGSRGLSKIKRAFLGSVSDYCAHHAKCPVLIVKPPSKTHK